MKKVIIAIFTLFMTLPVISLFGQKNMEQLYLEAGVSESLASYRKQFLSDILYQIQFTIPKQKSRAIESFEVISFTCKRGAKKIFIDFKEKEENLLQLNVNGHPIPILFKNEHLIIDSSYLIPGKNIASIKFIAGNLSLNRNEDFMYTLLVPDRARTVFPCFDQPDLKARFQLTLTIPKQWKALTNAPLLDSSVHEDTKTFKYDTSDIISTYLFSFAAGNFSTATRKTAGKEMTFYYRETDSSKIKHSIDPIFQIHQDAIRFMENYTQIPFPFKKFDFIAIPDFQYGGMEHVGAIQYKASTLFLDEGSTREEELSRSSLLSHETAHMWFGDLVTMRWFNDVWMKEVFANFMSDKITQIAQPYTNYDLKFLMDHFPAAYNIDRTAGSHPIRQPLENLQDAGSLYGNIIYHKAPIMMRQLEELMGKESFRKGLQEYLRKYAFNNATWPELIKILDKYTPDDLISWDKVWVNEAGRPKFTYSIEKKDKKISRFIIKEKGEDGSNRIWPQVIELAVVYPEKIEKLTLPIKHTRERIKELEGKPLPLFFLLNSSGIGYGLFPVDTAVLTRISLLKDPVVRASVYINLYENMLSSGSITPGILMDFSRKMLFEEKEELNLRLITSHISDIFWRYTLPEGRQAIVQSLEKDIWNALTTEPVANKKKILFKLYQNIALSTIAQERLYDIWQKQAPPAGVKLTEEDYTSLALALAVRDYPDKHLLEVQMKRIQNEDRKKRLAFITPALSSDSAIRDAFFTSLKEEKNREKEAWVVLALQYLHHPLRTAYSQKYLKESLDLLQEIQLTGDIFFPQSWLQATLTNYQSPESAEIIKVFLRDHPNYNPKLRAKILQAADGVFRSVKIISNDQSSQPTY